MSTPVPSTTPVPPANGATVQIQDTNTTEIRVDKAAQEPIQDNANAQTKVQPKPIPNKVKVVDPNLLNNEIKINSDNNDPNLVKKEEPKVASSYRRAAYITLIVVGSAILILGTLMLLSQVLPHAGALTPLLKSIATFTAAGGSGMGISGIGFSAMIVGSGGLSGVIGVGGLIYNHYSRRKPEDFLGETDETLEIDTKVKTKNNDEIDDSSITVEVVKTEKNNL